MTLTRGWRTQKQIDDLDDLYQQMETNFENWGIVCLNTNVMYAGLSTALKRRTTQIIRTSTSLSLPTWALPSNPWRRIGKLATSAVRVFFVGWRS